MSRHNSALLLALLLSFSVRAQSSQGMTVSLSQNNRVIDFSLVDVVSNKLISISDFSSKKAVVVVFMNTYCPYSKIYEDRIVALFEEYSGQNVGFLLINSNNSQLDTRDSENSMQKHATSRAYPFPYLSDKDNIAKNILKAEKNPETFILIPNNNNFIVAYRGAIDDNPQSPEQVGSNYIRMALNNIVKKKPSPISYKRPVGCRIKSM